MSKFDMRLKGGDGGILAVTRSRTRKFDLCKGSHTARIETDAQNGKRADFRVKAKPPCGSKAGAKSKRVKSSKR